MTGRLLVLFSLLLIAGCGEAPDDAVPPAPQELSRADIGYYCNMIVADHEGPKAQILLRDREQAIWFSSVRDALAFTRLPEEPKAIAAIYVNDMAKASWEQPEPGTWINAEDAHYVIGSARRGGMGAEEAVPFGDAAAAEAFAAGHGGRVVAMEEIPDDYILNAELEMPDGPNGRNQEAHGSHAQQDDH